MEIIINFAAFVGLLVLTLTFIGVFLYGICFLTIAALAIGRWLAPLNDWIGRKLVE